MRKPGSWVWVVALLTLLAALLPALRGIEERTEAGPEGPAEASLPPTTGEKRAALPPLPSVDSAPVAAPEAGRRLLVKVVDARGAPVGGAEVRAVHSSTESVQSTADDDGTTELFLEARSRDLTVGARSEGFAPTLVGGVSVDAGEVTLTLHSPWRLHGAVRSPDGDRLPGVRVSLQLHFPGAPADFVTRRTRTDESGTYEFTGLSRTRSRLDATRESGANLSVELETPVGGDVRMDLDFPWRPSLAGRVLDTRAKPVEGCTVWLRAEGKDWVTATTDEEGRWRRDDVPAATHEIRAGPTGDGRLGGTATRTATAP
ncbi:MAG: carboxypeptidase-like regulatory domain-containing protein, partial [Planctomycetota bacterium]